MKNNIFYTFFLSLFILNLNLVAQEIDINASTVKYDNVKKVTIFEGSVNSIDEQGNQFFSEYAKYNKLEELFETVGKTKIITSGGYEVLGSNVTFDNKKKIIQSSYRTQIKDKDGNKIFVDMFNYSTLTNIFFSQGNIKIIDINNNNYNFSEIYVDENKKKIIGSDVKAFLNQNEFLSNSDNEPRFFANTMSLSKKTNTFQKGIFTYCKNKKNEKCPPWVLQSKKIRHDLAKKTIYYDNVVLKIYDFPIFFTPKFSHPDPTVKRRSGILAPALSDSSTMGTGLSVPYFWNISDDRDITFSPKIYLNKNPLMLAEYRQDFKNSFLILDSGLTEGYKKINNKQTKGNRAHFFSKFNMNLLDEENKNSNLEINLQKVSNDTYFKIYDVDTSLVEKDKSILENNVNLTYQDNDFYFSFAPSIYEDLNKTSNLRNEYFLPINIEKNILTSQKYGFVDLESNIQLRSYETNKQTSFLVNDISWKSNKWLGNLGFENYFEGKIKAVNYDAKKTEKYKNEDTNSELHSALGFFSKLGLYKKDIINKNFYTLTPKLLLRYAPGHMRKIEGGKLNHGNLFNLNKIEELDVIESGLSSTVGFEYKINDLDEKNNISSDKFSLSAGQVISEKENMDIPSSTSLDQRFSDLVGESKFNFDNNIALKYNFSIDQNYKDFNYSEIGAEFDFEKTKFNLNYLQEKNHIGEQEYAQTEINYKLNNSTALNFSSKRNLATDSAEFYNLSYSYANDCLKAGIAYRREFYTDKDIEPANNLMFTISIIPFAQINSPGLSR